MTETKDFMQDICKYVVGTGFFEKIRVQANAKDTIIESFKEKAIVLKGKSSAVTGLEGEFGLSNVDLLKHICGDPEYNAKESKMDVTYATRDGDKDPSEFGYTNKSKTFITYRLMNKKLIPNQPKFIEPKWDVIVKPSKASVSQFGWAAAGLSGYEQYFVPKVVAGELKFFIGEENAASQRGGIVFAEGLKDDFDCQLRWRIADVMTVLKLGDSADCEMSITAKGGIKITLTTGIGTYSYMFPATPV
jgi:hypothetical protein